MIARFHRERLDDFHRNESGAVVLLCLAGVMIVMLTAWVLFDVGDAARDKMDVQIAADTAAYSHAAVKARSMNMIAYTNVSKRMYYNYSVIYAAGYLALLEATAMYIAEAARWGNQAYQSFQACLTCASGVGAVLTLGAACAKCAMFPVELKNTIENTLAAIEGIIQTAMETTEFLQANMRELYENRAPREVKALDDYQIYMMDMTPWWAWSEGSTRAMRNGATTAASWPVPPNSGDLGLHAAANSVLGRVDQLVGSVMSCPVTETGAADVLPLDKVPVNEFVSHGKLCASTRIPTSNWEFWVPQYGLDHWKKSEGYWSGSEYNVWKGTKKPGGSQMAPQTAVSVFELVMQAPIGCVIASLSLGGDDGNAVLPFEFTTDVSVPWMQHGDLPDAWLLATSNLSLAYKQAPERFDDEGARQKFGMIEKDYEVGGSLNVGGASLGGRVLYENGGYWALTRAEIAYQAGLMEAVGDVMENSGLGGGGAFFEDMLDMDILKEPNMYAPGWTARLRPFHLRQGELPIGMQSIWSDMRPFIATGYPVGAALEQGDNILGGGGGFDVNSIPNAARSFGLDMAYMQRVACTLDQEAIEQGAIEK